MERPLGITIIAGLAIIFGVLGILGSLAAIAVLPILGIVLLVLSVGQVAFGWGAWTLKPWAWTVGVALQGLSLVLTIINILSGTPFTSQILNLIINAAILYYLFTPTVQRAFGRVA